MSFWKILLVVAGFSMLGAEEVAKPNVIVIVSDDAGYNEFSMHGAKLFPTPRIDSIARNGVRFSNGYVSDEGGPFDGTIPKSVWP